MIIGGGCEWLLCGKCNGLAADVRVGDIQTTDMPDAVRACTCPDRPKKFPLEKPMTDFDTKLAELEANSDRVPELKMVVELFKMVGPKPPKFCQCADDRRQWRRLNDDPGCLVLCLTCNEAVKDVVGS